MAADDELVSEWFREYRATRDRRVRDRLIEHHAWIAQRCVRRFADRGEPVADLLQVAQIGIVKAVERFDPELGYGFPAFAMPTVTGEIRRHFRDATWDVAVPRRSKDLIANLNDAVSSLHQRLGRPPRVDEVARCMGITDDVVLETMEAARCYRSASLDEPTQGSDTNTVYERLGADDPELADADVRLSAAEAIRRLDPRSRRIILWRFYEGLTQSEIGARLGVGQVQVSRLLRAALATLRTHLDADEHDGEPGEPGDQGEHGERRQGRAGLVRSAGPVST